MTYPVFKCRHLSFKVDNTFLSSMPVQPLALEVFAVGVDLLPQGLQGVLLRASCSLDFLKSTQQLLDADLVLILNRRQLLQLGSKLPVIRFRLYTTTRDNW